jgi:hypothetical protein
VILAALYAEVTNCKDLRTEAELALIVAWKDILSRVWNLSLTIYD